jgi:hemerythrin
MACAFRDECAAADNGSELFALSLERIVAFIDWNEKYSVGAAEMDHQHQTWFNLLNELHDAMRLGKGHAVLGKCLDRVSDYTVKHFNAEQELMARSNYPGLGDHVVEHSRLVQQVKTLRDRFEAGEAVLTMDVMDFLRRWLYDHILENDRQYKGYIQ